jgi:hypothetical protein
MFTLSSEELRPMSAGWSVPLPAKGLLSPLRNLSHTAGFHETFSAFLRLYK